ncbi:hypothetical protein EDB92DRAFT_1820202 [Lactarius akahatsu]|uniref:Uncharacterized protein n=1 Tax=Lactarius akahatsu TaxID=416441 RepID=A0AAD4Q8T1_9AGAM|nr:hypothetical protein EDB92DRAFT_1820202 [Lactarius akahatsu]
MCGGGQVSKPIIIIDNVMARPGRARSSFSSRMKNPKRRDISTRRSWGVRGLDGGASGFEKNQGPHLHPHGRTKIDDIAKLHTEFSRRGGSSAGAVMHTVVQNLSSFTSKMQWVISRGGRSLNETKAAMTGVGHNPHPLSIYKPVYGYSRFWCLKHENVLYLARHLGPRGVATDAQAVSTVPVNCSLPPSAYSIALALVRGGPSIDNWRTDSRPKMPANGQRTGVASKVGRCFAMCNPLNYSPPSNARGMKKSTWHGAILCASGWFCEMRRTWRKREDLLAGATSWRPPLLRLRRTVTRPVFFSDGRFPLCEERKAGGETLEIIGNKLAASNEGFAFELVMDAVRVVEEDQSVGKNFCLRSINSDPTPVCFLESSWQPRRSPILATSRLDPRMLGAESQLFAISRGKFAVFARRGEKTDRSEPNKVEGLEPLWGAAAAGRASRVAITGARQPGSDEVNFKASSHSCKHVGCLALPNSAPPRRAGTERTVWPIVVSVLFNGDTARATFQRTKAAAVGSEALLKLSCVHRYCPLLCYTRMPKRGGEKKQRRNGRDDRSSLLTVLASRRRLTKNSRFSFNTCFFLLRLAFGTTISRTRARVHCARCWTSGSQRLRMIISRLLSRAHAYNSGHAGDRTRITYWEHDLSFLSHSVASAEASTASSGGDERRDAQGKKEPSMDVYWIARELPSCYQS